LRVGLGADVSDPLIGWWAHPQFFYPKPKFLEFPVTNPKSCPQQTFSRRSKSNQPPKKHRGIEELVISLFNLIVPKKIFLSFLFLFIINSNQKGKQQQQQHPVN